MKVTTNNAVMALLGDVYTLKVQFRNGKGNDDFSPKVYTYMSTEPVEAGEIVIVDSPYSGMAFCRVVQCDICDFIIDADYDYKFIIDVVNQKKHGKLMAAIEEFKSTLVRRQRQKLIREFREEYGLEEGDTDIIAKIRKKFFKK